MVDVAVGRDVEHPVEEDPDLPPELLADDGGNLLGAVDLLEEGAAAVAEVDAQRVPREVGAAAGKKAVDRHPLAAEAGDDFGQVVARKELARIARADRRRVEGERPLQLAGEFGQRAARHQLVQNERDGQRAPRLVEPKPADFAARCGAAGDELYVIAEYLDE